MKFLALILIVFALPVQAETRVPETSAEISLSFAPVVRAAAPAVVNIYAKRVTQQRSIFADDPFFDGFFENFGRARPQVQNSLGSGVILSGDGLVVTNFHVVGMATDIRVVLKDRREYAARVLLGDQDSDLAILQLEGAKDLPSLPLRSSDSVEVGELVLAIGNPFGVGQTVSSGIVSGLARSGGAIGSRGYFLQTDAPINPGNSGGALIDVAGHLIGVNTRIVTRSGGSNGLGFAIPADLVAAFMRQAKAGRDRFERPWAGVTGQMVDQDMVEMLGLDRPEGIIIAGLHPKSPFGAAGFAVGDVITAVDGAPVNSPSEMVFRMSVAGAGDAVIERLRDGRRTEVPVALIAPPEDPSRATLSLSKRSIFPGMRIMRINPAVIVEYGLPFNSTGVVVADPGRAGARLGLRTGDVLVRLNGKVIEKTGDLAFSLSTDRRFELDALRGQKRLVLRFKR